MFFNNFNVTRDLEILSYGSMTLPKIIKFNYKKLKLDTKKLI